MAVATSLCAVSLLSDGWQDTRLAVHLFRGRSTTPPLLLPAPAGSQVEEQGGGAHAPGDLGEEGPAPRTQAGGSAGGGGSPASPAPRPARLAVDAATQVTPLSCRSNAHAAQPQHSAQVYKTTCS